jgi:CXC domain
MPHLVVVVVVFSLLSFGTITTATAQELMALVDVDDKVKRSMLYWNCILDDLATIDVSACFVRFCRDNDEDDDGKGQRLQLMNLITCGAINGAQFRQLMTSIVTAAVPPPMMMDHQEKDEEITIDSYEKWTDSLRTHFCRACCRFNCSVHGTTVKPSARQQMETSLLVDAQRNGEVSWIKMYEFVMTTEAHQPRQQPPHQQRLTAFQEVMFGAAYHVYQGNGDDVATFLGLPTAALVKDHVQRQCHVTELLVRVPVKKRRICKGKRWGPFSIRNYHKKMYRKACQTDWLSIPDCQPCHHDGECTTATDNNSNNNKNCSCVQHNMFCTVACGHRELSNNFFRGCKCRGDCRTDQCPCRAANRACDPALCRHQHTHTNNNKKNNDNKYACRNTISHLGQEGGADTADAEVAVELLVARSTIAGYGCFTNRALLKGDYIGEYVGEMIPPDEAKRREALIRAQNGQQQQQRGMYFFDLSADVVIDSTFCGNETRFINHAAKGYYNVTARSTYRILVYLVVVVLFFVGRRGFVAQNHVCFLCLFVLQPGLSRATRALGFTRSATLPRTMNSLFPTGMITKKNYDNVLPNRMMRATIADDGYDSYSIVARIIDFAGTTRRFLYIYIMSLTLPR